LNQHEPKKHQQTNIQRLDPQSIPNPLIQDNSRGKKMQFWSKFIQENQTIEVGGFNVNSANGFSEFSNSWVKSKRCLGKKE
jgi:hypothetical protein